MGCHRADVVQTSSVESVCPPSFFASLPLCLYALLVRPRHESYPSEEQRLYISAISSAASRHSVYEMRVYLERRAEDKNTVAVILDRMKRNNYLDDARYAKQFVRVRSELRRQGPFRIARDLRARGVPDRHIESALAERAAEFDQTELVRAQLSRKLKSLRGPLDDRRKASLYRSLLRSGFAPDTIRRELMTVAKISLDQIAEGTDERE